MFFEFFSALYTKKKGFIRFNLNISVIKFDILFFNYFSSCFNLIDKFKIYLGMPSKCYFITDVINFYSFKAIHDVPHSFHSALGGLKFLRFIKFTAL